MSLASAACISELNALGRGLDYMEFHKNGSVSISMVRTFIAKNESPVKRWAPFVIPPLPQKPELCPVKALEHYLCLSKDFGGVNNCLGGKQMAVIYL